MKKMTRYVMADILRNRIVIAYMLFLMVISFSIFSLEDNTSKGLLSLLNIVLLIVPLVSLIFSTIYVYNSAEFIELLVSQPVKRKVIWTSLFCGLAVALCLAFIVGVGIPVLIYAPGVTGWIMMACGCLLSAVFVSLALWGAVKIRDKAKGIGLAIMIWLLFTLLFDGLILWLLFQFADYPIENGMVAVISLNPVDLCRIFMLLFLDMSALMGYTGAVFKQFFGSVLGMIVSCMIMVLWVIIPFLLSLRIFNRKDL
ncbi:ABC-2 transporter permease [Chitinophaga tropicalis]|uniref:ABC transporter permease subunit n=1 Tax=Chitinophaga tropicalis TaxID=2683588 RepID=A0A7K1U5C9_9BACT|nr:ABC transporter permease subunit [Chitinophaga tropicalis]MVT09568.1 ABC transporter permease subunit [Chitinophaga tropicalis]